MKQTQETGLLVLNKRASDGHFTEWLNSLSPQIIFIAVLYKGAPTPKKKPLGSNSGNENKNAGPLEEDSLPSSSLQHQEHIQTQTILEVFI